MHAASLTRSASRLLCGMVVLCVLALGATPARAAFHLWQITEIYSNASGTLQFIEMRDDFGFQDFISGQQIQVSNISNTQTNTFTIPTDTPGPTLGRSLLFGTAGLQAAGGPAPDFIIPNGFLFTAGGTLNFFGLNGGAYTALPTDGLLSRTWGDGNAINTPTNFRGERGQVPAPGTMLLAAGAGWLSAGARRRRT